MGRSHRVGASPTGSSEDVGRLCSLQQLAGCSQQCPRGASALCPESLQASSGRQPERRRPPLRHKKGQCKAGQQGAKALPDPFCPFSRWGPWGSEIGWDCPGRRATTRQTWDPGLGLWVMWGLHEFLEPWAPGEVWACCTPAGDPCTEVPFVAPQHQQQSRGGDASRARPLPLREGRPTVRVGM